MRAVTTRITISTFLTLVAAIGLMAQDSKEVPKPKTDTPELGPVTKPNLADKDKDGKPATGADPFTATQGMNAPVDPNTYKIGPEDVLYIRVWKEP